VSGSGRLRPSATAEPVRATQEAAVGKHVPGVGVQRPAGARCCATQAGRCAGCRRHPDETVVERQTVTDRVLPATSDVRPTVVREPAHDRGVYISQSAPEKQELKLQRYLRGSGSLCSADILHHWHQTIENNCAVKAVFIDYAKAFYHVDHTIVVQKLLDLGVPNVLVRWLCYFLFERQRLAC